MGALTCLLEFVFGTTAHDDAAVVNVMLQYRLQRERLRLAVNESQHVHAECRAQRGELQQLVEHLMWIRILLDLNIDAHAVAVGLIAQVGDAVEALLFDEIGNLLNE